MHAPSPLAIAARRAAARLVVPLAALALVTGTATAQRPLVELLPGTTVAVLDVAGLDLPALDAVLGDLDLERARTTLARIATRVGGAAEGVEDQLATLDGRRLIAEALVSGCAPAEAALAAGADGIRGPAVAAVAVSPFSPFPGVVVALRPDDPTVAAALVDALASCEPDPIVLRQDDVELLVLDDASDMPLVLAAFDDLALIGTDPELVRAVVRIARGSQEPRFVDGRLGRAVATMAGDGITAALDLAAIVAATEGLVAAVPTPPEAGDAVGRGLAALRTLGGVALNVRADDGGLTVETVLAPDPAGDPDLYAVLTCASCPPAPRPDLVPAGPVSVAAGSVALDDLVTWLDAIVVELASAGGPPGLGAGGLRGALADLGGFDVDAALLDWWTGTWTSAQLDPLATDLRAWLVGAGTVLVLETTSEEAARAGVSEWRELLRALPFLATAFDPGPGVDPLEAGGVLSVRPQVHRGVAYERWRVGPLTDLGVLVHDGRVVVTSPAATMRRVIDVASGDPSVLDDPLLAAALAGVPAGAIGYAIDDLPRQLRGLAAITDLVAAPVASALMLAVVETRVEAFPVPGADGTWRLTGMDAWPDALGDDPRPGGAPSDGTLAVPASVQVEITEDGVLSNGEYGLVFDLVGLVAGDVVQIEMLDADGFTIDTFLYLFDFGAGEIVAANDDAPGTDRSEIVFRVEEGVSYGIVASSYSGFETGAVILNTRVLETAAGLDTEIEPAGAGAAPAGDARDDAPPVTFDDVVHLVDVATGFLEGLADRAGIAVGITRHEDGVLRSVTRVPLR